MRRVLIVCLAVLLAMSHAQAIEFSKPVPDGLDTSVTIKVKPVDFASLRGATAEEWDQTLFPSGMQIPTKYLDLSLAYDIGEETTISSAVYVFLVKNWPCLDKTYTYAEILAARMWVHIWSVTQLPVEEMSSALSAKMWLGSIGEETVPTTTSVVISSPELFWSAVVSSIASESIEADAEIKTTGGAPVRFDAGFNWEGYVLHGPNSVTEQKLSDFWETRLQYMQDVGLKVVQSETSLCDFNVLYPEEQTFETGPGGAFDTGETEVQKPATAPEEPAKTEPPKYAPEYLGDSYVDTVPVITNGFGEVDREIGLRDTYTTVCIILAIVFITVGAVVDYLKKRDDPSRKYKRW